MNLRPRSIFALLGVAGIATLAAVTSLDARPPEPGKPGLSGLSQHADGYIMRGNYSVQLCHNTKGFDAKLPTVIHGVSEVSLLDEWFVMRIETRPASTVILPRSNVVFLQVDE